MDVFLFLKKASVGEFTLADGDPCQIQNYGLFHSRTDEFLKHFVEKYLNFVFSHFVRFTRIFNPK
jgi:hypothetical protein